MAKKHNPDPINWDNQTPKILETHFIFPKSLPAKSLCLKKKKKNSVNISENHETRVFKTGRLIEINTQKKEFTFVGPKIVPRNGKTINNKRKYLFVVPFHEMEQLVS